MINLKESCEARTPPIERGQIINGVKVVGVGKTDTGYAKVGGFIVFIPDSKVGERYDIKINNVLPTFAFGEIV